MWAAEAVLGGMTADQVCLLGAGLAGLAVFLLARAVLGGVPAARVTSPLGETFEDRRRGSLRQGNSLYRALEPLVDALAAWNGRRAAARLPRLERELAAAGERLPWRPEEYLAIRQLEGALVGVAVAVFLFQLTRNLPAAALLGGVAGWGLAAMQAGDPARRARRRLGRLKARLPFTIDLMALMMEAGAGFREALATGVEESGDSPVSEEFGQVLKDTDMGRTRREALVALQQRLDDRELSELIFAIVKGEEMGTPLADILSTQAGQMRLKRSQQAEREAAEAQVSILFPGLLVMLACILIITGPFLLQVLYQPGGLAGLF